MNSPVFQVRLLGLDELNADMLSAWESLEEKAIEPNAYLSPCFVLPALHHLCSEAEAHNTRLLFVERLQNSVADLVGAGVVAPSRAGRRFPLPHLKSFLSIHSYLSGFLLDRRHAEAAMRAVLSFLRKNRRRWHGMDLPCLPAEGAQAELLFKTAREGGGRWSEHSRSMRAVFVPSEGGEQYLAAHLSSHRIKRLRQARRRLESRGPVAWRSLFGREVADATIDRFLELEHLGWKGEKGTALRSRPSEEAFFREMMECFRRRGRVFFTEILLGGSVIASTSNIISGEAGFAFKIAWDPEYASTSPGALNELEFIRQAPSLCGGLSFIDSGAEEGSFIDQLWAKRRSLVSGVLGISGPGKTALTAINLLRGFRTWGRSL